jgi:protein XRP2
MTTSKSLDRQNYMFLDKSNQVLIKKKGEINGKNFKIKNLNNCEVYLLDFTSGIFIDNCDDCKFIIGPCDGSVYMRTSNRCTISIITKQMRFRETYDIKVNLYCISDPVIESSKGMVFGPFDYKLPYLDELFHKANFKKNENKYEKVYDFCPSLDENTNWRLAFKEEVVLKEFNSGLYGIDCENKDLYEEYKDEVYMK